MKTVNASKVEKTPSPPSPRHPPPNGLLNGFEGWTSQSAEDTLGFSVVAQREVDCNHIFYGKVFVPVAICSNGSLALPSAMDRSGEGVAHTLLSASAYMWQLVWIKSILNSFLHRHRFVIGFERLVAQFGGGLAA